MSLLDCIMEQIEDYEVETEKAFARYAKVFLCICGSGENLMILTSLIKENDYIINELESMARSEEDGVIKGILSDYYIRYGDIDKILSEFGKKRFVLNEKELWDFEEPLEEDEFAGRLIRALIEANEWLVTMIRTESGGGE